MDNKGSNNITVQNVDYELRIQIYYAVSVLEIATWYNFYTSLIEEHVPIWLEKNEMCISMPCKYFLTWLVHMFLIIVDMVDIV